MVKSLIDDYARYTIQKIVNTAGIRYFLQYNPLALHIVCAQGPHIFKMKIRQIGVKLLSKVIEKYDNVTHNVDEISFYVRKHRYYVLPDSKCRNKV